MCEVILKGFQHSAVYSELYLLPHLVCSFIRPLSKSSWTGKTLYLFTGYYWANEPAEGLWCRMWQRWVLPVGAFMRAAKAKPWLDGAFIVSLIILCILGCKRINMTNSPISPSASDSISKGSQWAQHTKPFKMILSIFPTLSSPLMRPVGVGDGPAWSTGALGLCWAVYSQLAISSQCSLSQKYLCTWAFTDRLRPETFSHETSTLGSGAQVASLLSILLPSCVGLETLRSSGELPVTDVKVNARLLLAFKGLPAKSLHVLTLKSLPPCISHSSCLSGATFSAFSLCLPGSNSTEAPIKHHCCVASQCSARMPAFPARRRRIKS